MDFRAGLDVLRKRAFLVLAGIRKPDYPAPSPVIVPTTPFPLDITANIFRPTCGVKPAYNRNKWDRIFSPLARMFRFIEVLEVWILGTVKFFRQTEVFVMQGFCLTHVALYTRACVRACVRARARACVCVCVCGVAVEVASSAGDFSVRSIQHQQRGHHLIIIRTNGRTDRQNNEMVITGGGQILYGNYTQRGPGHATSKGLCWQQEHVNST